MPKAGEIVAKQADAVPGDLCSQPLGKALIAQHCDVWLGEYKPGYRNFEEYIALMAPEFRSMDALAQKCRRKLRHAINPQVICADTQAEAERLAESGSISS